MVDQITSAVSLSTFDFLFPDVGENIEIAESVNIPLPELPSLSINDEFLGLNSSVSPVRNFNESIPLNPPRQPQHHPLFSVDTSYYEMQHLRAQYQDLERRVDCLNQNLQCVQDEYECPSLFVFYQPTDHCRIKATRR